MNYTLDTGSNLTGTLRYWITAHYFGAFIIGLIVLGLLGIGLYILYRRNERRRAEDPLIVSFKRRSWSDRFFDWLGL
jgi:F0F1-type ATP synthase assembly protein I